MGILLALIIGFAPCKYCGTDALAVVDGQIMTVEMTGDEQVGDVYTVVDVDGEYCLDEYLGYVY